jgi:hypothetical protein
MNIIENMKLSTKIIGLVTILLISSNHTLDFDGNYIHVWNYDAW